MLDTSAHSGTLGSVICGSEGSVHLETIVYSVTKEVAMNNMLKPILHPVVHQGHQEIQKVE